ncbi:MAG: CinA family nicotinamide mononucleotide deamidase-related protein [Spongiibacteraceae bacterium]
MKIQLLLTGNELMSGHTIDSNSAMIGDLLASEGYTIYGKTTVGDNIDQLVNELQRLSLDSDVLIVNGGLGPTVDDLTAEALSRCSGQVLAENATALKHLTNWCNRRNIALNAANLKQAVLPVGVDIIANPIGSAVGFSLTHNNCLIICTSGVPNELRAMLSDSIIALICQRFPNNRQISTRRFQTFGLGESNLQQLITNEYKDWPSCVELGFRVGMPLLEVKLTIQDPEHLPIQTQCYQRLEALIGDYIIGEGGTNLAEAVIAILQQQNKKITTAESCTGGLIAASITEVAGASSVFEAGIVSYSNTMKQTLLGVPEAILLEHGAVSEEVVRAMVNGAIERSGADVGIAVSGIAGPEGGTETKPVGTVWMAWGEKNNIQTRRLQFNTSRQGFQSMVTATTLDLVRRELLGIEQVPRYFRDKTPNKT